MEHTLTLVFRRENAWIRYCFPDCDESGTRGNPFSGLPCLHRPIAVPFLAHSQLVIAHYRAI